VYVLEIVVCPFVLFLLPIVLSVLLRYTDSDYPFGIFKLFFLQKHFLMDPVTNMSDISKSKLIVTWYKSFIVVVNKF